MRLSDTLVPTRFLCTIGHLVLLVMIFYTKEKNINAALGDNFTSDEFDEKNRSTLAVLWLSIICIAVEAIGLFGGFTLFNHGANTFYIICHFCASVLLAWFIMESWHWLTLWYVFGFFSVVPAMVETSAIIRVVFFKVAQY